MGIYDDITGSGELSLAEKQRETTLRLKSLVTTNFRNLITIYNSGFAIINNNDYGLTRNEVIAGMSPEDWTKFFEHAVMLKKLINHIRPGTIIDFVGEPPPKIVAGQAAIEANPEVPAEADVLPAA
jgi:hypothetical protein